MLIEFTFGNFRSFRDPITLSMAAANIKSEDPSVDENNVITVSPKLNLLTSAAIYGANASGKSNLIQAIGFMRHFVLNSSRESQAGEEIGVEAFKLSTLTENQPSLFEVIFLDNGVRVRYGFEVSQQCVAREWLYMTPTIREAEMFIRQDSTIQFNPRRFREGRGLAEKTRPNALFLSVAAQFNGPIALKIQKLFKKIGIISGLLDINYRDFTLEKFVSDQGQSQAIKQFVRALDLDIEDIDVQEQDPTQVQFPKDMPDELKKLVLKSPGKFVLIRTSHKKYDSDHQVIGVEPLDFEDEESDGTRKLFYLAGPVLDTLEKGKVLWIDEMEARMHPLITSGIIQLFNSKETNPNHAQLIFTTHDTNLLDRKLFRRDQIWFTEKDRYGSSHLYSMVEFKPRYDSSYEKDYLRGKFGAIPYPGDFSQVLAFGRKVAEEQGEYDAKDQ